MGCLRQPAELFLVITKRLNLEPERSITSGPIKRAANRWGVLPIAAPRRTRIQEFR